MTRTIVGFLLCVCAAWAQTNDPAYALLDKAYAASRAKKYDEAVAAFEQAIAIEPKRAAIRKDLAYTLVKIGENEAARDQFAAAMKINPEDTQVALEYAFLCYETKQEAIARRVFDRLRKTGNATAEQAFQNIDRPLGEEIDRWKKVADASPDNFSAHDELAQAAEKRDELLLAAEHYEKAWRLKPSEPALLLDLGRVWQALGHTEDANAALVAAAHGTQPRVAEQARELLPSRYPYVYEFQKALTLDPKNVALRRELAYLLLQMGQKADAEKEFQALNQLAPNDLLTAAQLGFLRLGRHDAAGAQPLFDQVLKGDDEELADRVRTVLKMPQTLKKRVDTPSNRAAEAKQLADKSYNAGYMKDAVKYLNIAHESDPMDFGVMLKLGWALNILRADGEAEQWFALARNSPDPAIASEAGQAYNNLRPEFERTRTTAWIFPFFSTRWHDAFGYGQVKTEFNIGTRWIKPYLSVRFIGDTKDSEHGGLSGIQPQYLSETSFIAAAGLATTPWHNLVGWVEAGEAIKYLTDRTDVGRMVPDYRGGLSYVKGFGHMLGGSKGLFAESTNDGVYISRFQDDMLVYSQNRFGYTFNAEDSFAGLRAQLYWNANMTVDRLRLYWANYVETGPGIRFRIQAMPKPVYMFVNLMRGAYTVNEGNPRKPNYYDVRVGFWYAISR